MGSVRSWMIVVEVMQIPARRRALWLSRDDLADLILGSPAVGFLPKAPSAPPRSQVCSAHAPESLRLEDTIVYVTTTRLFKRFP